MKEMLDRSRPMPAHPFMSYNHIEIDYVEQDRACVCLDIVRESTNSYHMVHGGAYFTMADCCAGLAAHTDGRRYVTQGASVQFVRNTGSGRVTARSVVTSRGRTLCLAEVRGYAAVPGHLHHVLHRRPARIKVPHTPGPIK